MAALLSSVIPSFRQCDDGDVTHPVTIHVFGSGFVDPTTKINYDGADIPTTFVSATHLTADLNPSGASRPKYVPIKVTGDAVTVRLFNWQPNAIPGSTKSWYPPTP